MSENHTFVAEDCWGCHKRPTRKEAMDNWAPLFRRDRRGDAILLGDMVWCDECYPYPSQPRQPQYVQG